MCPYAEPTPSLPYVSEMSLLVHEFNLFTTKLNPIILGQGRVQRILSTHLREYGCEIEYDTELKSFEQFEDHVATNLVKFGGNVEKEINVTATYVIGADGTRGTVRKLLGLSFLGETRTREHWVIADVQLNNIHIDKNVSRRSHSSNLS
jgi:2-polyprenyl-6-methoxyphenol hydroxylase-like FAD-dependent oxidoreductase